MATQKEILELRKKVIEQMEDKGNERLLYIIPYKEFYLTNPNKSNEIAIPLQDIYIVFKQIRDNQDNLKRKFELYNKDLEQIGYTNENNRLIYDKEITETIIQAKNKIKELMENGKVADLDKEGNIEVYFEMINKKLVTLDKKEKIMLDRARNNKTNNKENKKNSKQGLENKVDVEKEDFAERKKLVAQNLDIKGIKPEDIDKTTVIRDELFYLNNPECKDNIIAAKLKDGRLLMLTQTDDGRFVQDDTFDNPTNEQGRASVMTTDTDAIKEYNTYGAIYRKDNKNIRYVTKYDDATGEIQILMQKRITQNESGQTISDNDYWSPAVEMLTDNTDEHVRSERESEGISANNTIRNMWNQRTNENYRMNREATRIIQNEGETLTPENISDEENVRIKTAVKDIITEMESRGKSLSNEEKEKIKDNIKMLNKKGFTKEDVKQYCDAFEKQNEQNKENDNEKEPEVEEERTLENDALRRRAQMRFSGN